MTASDTQHETTHAGVELPAPTASPMVCAFGTTLLFAGIVTTFAVAIFGFALALVGAIGWWRESHPDSSEELIPLEAPPAPVEPRVGAVDHLMTADSLHRARIPVAIHPYRAGFVGGLLGGACMAIMAVVWGLISHGSLWYTVNLLAGTMLSSLGDMTTAELTQFHAAGLIVGIVLHVSMSVMVGLLYGVTLPLLPRYPMAFAAVVVPLIWTGLTWASISVVNPALADHIQWLWFIGTQVVFGLVAGWWVVRSEKIGTMQNWHFLERLGVDAPGVHEMGGDA